MYRPIVKPVCGVWCELCEDFNYFGHLELQSWSLWSQCYTQSSVMRFFKVGDTILKDLCIMSLSVFIFKSQIGTCTWFTILLKVNFLYRSWLSSLYNESWPVYLEDTLKSKYYKQSTVARDSVSVQYQRAGIEN